jgi:hypothetical protein
MVGSARNDLIVRANARLSKSLIVFFDAGKQVSECTLWFENRGNFRHGGGLNSKRVLIQQSLYVVE